jgi:Xaa-Pro aminopeptidase
MEARLIYGTPETHSDLLYWGHFWAPDPFWALKIQDETVAIVSTLEWHRCRKESTFKTVYLLEDLLEKAQKKYPPLYRRNKIGALFQWICEKYGISRWIVPKNFPLFAYRAIGRTAPIKMESPLCPQRIVKTPEEIRAIRAANAVAEKCFERITEILAECKIGKNNRLVYQNSPLTSETLRTLVEIECLSHGATAQRTIVAGGSQAAQPHGLGHGPLKAHELLVVDLFPRVSGTGYYGDMTRTFLKGTPSDAQRALIESVLKVHRETISKLRPGCNGAVLYREAQERFEADGFPVRKMGNRITEGFVHSLGHGLGLDLHEAPGLNQTNIILREGMVFTIEPGLYYPNLGGARIEDVCVLTENGYELLSHFHYRWCWP